MRLVRVEHGVRLLTGKTGIDLTARMECSSRSRVSALARLRDNFVERVFACWRLRGLLAARPTAGDRRLSIDLVPLVVPLTLVRHHVRIHEVRYLAGQIYLEPHPKELMLRNHV